MGKKKTSSWVDALVGNMSKPAPPMNLPPGYEYERGKRGGAWIVNKATGEKRYATDAEKKEYNLPKPSAFHKRELLKKDKK